MKGGGGELSRPFLIRFLVCRIAAIQSNKTNRSISQKVGEKSKSKGLLAICWRCLILKFLSSCCFNIALLFSLWQFRENALKAAAEIPRFSISHVPSHSRTFAHFQWVVDSLASAFLPFSSRTVYIYKFTVLSWPRGWNSSNGSILLGDENVGSCCV